MVNHSPNLKFGRLRDIGFVHAGDWRLDGETIAITIVQHATARNVLYAFVVDGEPLYVGKTVQTLRARMQGYRSPGPTQPTNRRNRRALLDKLQAGAVAQVYVLPDNGLMHYGGFHLNLAAGLEDSIIRDLQPLWNGGRKELAECVPDSTVNDQVTAGEAPLN